ncbi:MAG: dephospho-CoA kinase [Ignavibacteria bacterium]|nr:MAG: dephospho-CoA kinase [Chlorobi bacterium OLB4]
MIGVTGGIGSGKSEVCRILADQGFEIYNADLIAKDLYKKNKLLSKALINEFGEGILNFKGQISLAKLKQVIFKNKQNYNKLKKIVHPKVINHIKKLISKSKEKIVIIESALIFESGFEKDMNYIVMIYSNKKNRIKRIIERDGAKRKEIENIMSYQMNEQEKLDKADFVIVNNKGLDDLIDASKALAKMLRVL